jgi:2'-5' RNA ligase
VVQSVELILDDRSDAAVRRQWARLADTGLPSKARQTASTNRPHVTLAALASIDPSCEVALREAADGVLPLDLRLGAPAVFGRGPFVLARIVIPSRTLLAVHTRVAEIVGTPEATSLSPGRWTPHVTLAKRLTGSQVAAALAVLPAGDIEARGVAIRRWDSDARRDWVVTDTGPLGAGPAPT